MANSPAHRPEGSRPVRAVPETGVAQPQPVDARAATPGLLKPSRLRTLSRRFASIAALVAIDVLGLGAALYGSLVLRELYYGRSPDWSFLWNNETDWAPFLILIMLLVFVQGDL